ncbi:hypothetical protein [Pseudokordiimonas caeni]|uniref:hypothetical protein n=1 Tax=Pseudokordiimonas caeni TaxID=2997908 RepID=UPI0028123C05|nr:hypothetical protein [Pseudokordiimonas caeni]
MKNGYVPFCLMVMSLSLGGCTSVRIGEGQGQTHWHFGFVKIVEPVTSGVPEAYKLDMAGISIGSSLMLGWSSREEVLLPLAPLPAAGRRPEAPCHLVVIIRSTAEARHARSILEGLEGVDPCMVSFDGELPVVSQ